MRTGPGFWICIHFWRIPIKRLQIDASQLTGNILSSTYLNRLYKQMVFLSKNSQNKVIIFLFYHLQIRA